jgi:DNA-binding NarL/FixJ family response regulator
MRLIGALFYEDTNRRRLQDRLRGLHDKTEKLSDDEDELFAGESQELSVQSVEMLQQSIEMLDCSMAMRCQISEMRIVAALKRAAPFSCVTSSDLSSNAQPMLHPARLAPKQAIDFTDGIEPQNPVERHIDSPSHREQQIVQLLAEGNSNKEIAAILNLSIRTVESYRARLMMKLHIHSLAELVRYAVRNNLIKA